ncbi:MAG: DEAD/DEAH box helicase [Bacteroidales bacterium]|nr:DEAD/DEAH box helicase [Bacteroidales bacterium]
MPENQNNKKIIFTVVEHRLLGILINSYVVNINKNQAFYTTSDNLLKSKIGYYTNYLNDLEKEIIGIIDEYNENTIFKIFSKNKNSKEFYEKIDKQLIENRIRPYIEKRLARIIDLLIQNKNQLFYKEKKYSTIHTEDEIILEENFALAVFNFNKKHDCSEYFLSININGKELKLINRKISVISNDPCIIIIDNHLFRIKDIDAKKLLPFFNKNYVIIPKSFENKYFKTFILNSIKNFQVKAQGFAIYDIEPEKEAILSIGENLNTDPVLFLNFKYNTHQIKPSDNIEVFVDFYENDNNYEYKRYKRDLNWENNIISSLLDIGLENSKRDYFTLNENISEAELYGYISWFNKNQGEINKLGIVTSQHFISTKFYKGEIKLDFKISKKNDWFDIYALVKFGEFLIPFVKLKKYILNNIREFELPNGEIAILPMEWFSKYKDIYQFGKVEHENIKIKNFYSPLLKKKIDGIDQKYFDEYIELVNVENLRRIKIPENLDTVLRKYQVIGYKWMINLQKNRLGGCLADDMGLGKTIQTLAVLQNSKEKIQTKIDEKIRKKYSGEPTLFADSFFYDQKSALSPTSLIIAPASLVHNWENEIQKFTSELRVYKFTGSNRTKQQFDFQFYDIIITTYGLARNDIDVLQNFYFHYIILDESQIIKNPASKIYKAILKLKSEYKLVLTGTPIENSLIDLWSQINFLNRGLLGGLNFFKSEFINPIEKNNSVEIMEKLQLLIHSFILRRKKEEVARDLPPVTEQVLYCDMTEDHMKIYQEEKSKIRNLILENVDKDGLHKSAIIILQGLSKLRQLACHPKFIEADYIGNSGKFEEIIHHLNNIIAEGHKLLIFSSYIKHLSLIETYLKQNDINYSILTGQSTNRKQIIDDFQNDARNKVFLITLKAGGVGLNLTAADYVFIIDPWWNPASEEQAISRAHRIGQDKNVFIYRFITTNTIEEKIQILKEKKSGMANLFINSNNPFKGIDEKQVKELFE